MALDINQAYQLCIQACNDQYIGYSQTQRDTIKLGVTYRTYCDCASLMSWCCAMAGAWDGHNPWFSTIDEPTYLQQAGFTRMAANSVAWQPGDILTKDEGKAEYGPHSHTEMVYQGTGGSSGYTMGAHTYKLAFEDQVSIKTYVTDASYWEWLYRAGGTVIPAYHWTQVETNTYGALTSDEIYANAVLTYYELRNLGFTPQAAAGVMGNIEHEGQFNPAQWQGGSAIGDWYNTVVGYGMFQYTPGSKFYQNWAALQSGFDINDADLNGPYQVRWLDANPSQFNGSSSQMAGNAHYGISYNDYKNLTDPADAANVWLRSWERPLDPDATQSARETSAVYWYNEAITNFPSNAGVNVPAALWPWLPGAINNLKRRKIII